MVADSEADGMDLREMRQFAYAFEDGYKAALETLSPIVKVLAVPMAERGRRGNILRRLPCIRGSCRGQNTRKCLLALVFEVFYKYLRDFSNLTIGPFLKAIKGAEVVMLDGA